MKRNLFFFVITLVTAGITPALRLVYRQAATQAPCPLLLSNPNGRCVSNSLLQSFFALSRARGWDPGQTAAGDPFSLPWQAYAQQSERGATGYDHDIDFLAALTQDGKLPFDRYTIQDPARYIAQWLQKSIPQGAEKIVIITVKSPSTGSAAELAEEIEANIHATVLPEALIVLCDYQDDPINNWECGYTPENYRKWQSRTLTRPHLPAMVHHNGVGYRIVAVTHLVQQAMPTSAAGKFILSKAASAWKSLHIDPESHATACVRWGNQWYEMDDLIRYSITAESIDPATTIDASSTLIIDQLIMERHPGVPAICIYERCDIPTLPLSAQPLNQCDCVWSCPPPMAQHIKRHHFYDILHSPDSMPGACYRRFIPEDGFLPA